MATYQIIDWLTGELIKEGQYESRTAVMQDCYMSHYPRIVYIAQNDGQRIVVEASVVTRWCANRKRDGCRFGVCRGHPA